MTRSRSAPRTRARHDATRDRRASAALRAVTTEGSQQTMPHMLLVEDEDRFAEPITALAQRVGYSSSCARTLDEARQLLHQERRDLMLLDVSLPDGRGIELLEGGHAPELDLDRVIVMSDGAEDDPALRRFRPMVRDWLVKPLDLARVRSHLESLRVDGHRRGNGHHDHAANGSDDRPGNGCASSQDQSPLLGESRQLLELREMIARAAPTDVKVLIIGESGTGKELVARMIHDQSRRRQAPYLPLNCGAIPENLIEAELFGHEKGAFTGASRARRGVFERAHGGTLLLDEITEMPADMQVRLLRVLETGEVTRIGSERTIHVDVRIVAATNRPIAAALRTGKLREDLLYRLAVMPMQVAPLRERPEDIEQLAGHFLAILNQRYGSGKLLGAEARRQLRRHPWPGNVRQLRNVLERAFIVSDHTIAPDALTQPLELTPAGARSGDGIHVRVGSSLAEAERQLIAATLAHHRGDKRRTARTLGISLKTLYNRLNSYKAEGCAMEVG